MHYFTDREFGERPRTETEMPANVRDGILDVVVGRISDGSFGFSCPEQCPDGNAIIGTNEARLRGIAAAHRIVWPLDGNQVPDIGQLMDLIEFTYQRIGKPIVARHHGFFRHDHLDFNRDQGREEFREEINQIFGRNGLAYELEAGGKVGRLAPAVLREALLNAVFQTGDADLDRLLETARSKFLNRDEAVRRESLEKLWDAWERLKTIEPGKDKKEAVTHLLDRASAEANFRALLETEARALTDVGNTFMIRHTEVGKVPIDSSEHIDYLFHRLFALIRLLSRSSGRGG